MTPRQRLLTVLAGGIPDCVPVAPDFSNMIPARLTGKPFWDLYLYNDPPIWEAYIAAARRFNIDSLMDGYFPFAYVCDETDPRPWEQFIVLRNDDRIVTQASYVDGGKRVWSPKVDVYYRSDPPTKGVPPEKINLPPTPSRWEPLEGVRPVDTGPEGLRRVKGLLGDQGLVGISITTSRALRSEEDIYRYYDNPDLHEQLAARRVEDVERRFRHLRTLTVKPDFLCVGGSGTLVFQTAEIFRQLAFPAVKRAIELASDSGIPTHLHSCGPEKALVKIMVEETPLTVIDPLEIPPMGDCDLAELKRLHDRRITLKGNLHTTSVMLRGSPADVAAASKAAIDAAAEGGRFILSTGDQCGRDTPDQNILAMVETARAYGRY